MVLGYFILIYFVFHFGLAIGHGLFYYDQETFCCRHMCKTAEHFFESHGIDVQIMVGETKDGKSSHAWLLIRGIEIDSVWLIPWLNSQMYPTNLTTYENYEDLEADWFVKHGRPLN